MEGFVLWGRSPLFCAKDSSPQWGHICFATLSSVVFVFRNNPDGHDKVVSVVSH